MSVTILCDGLKLTGAALFVVAALQDVAWRLVPNVIPLAITGSGATLRLLEGSLQAGIAVAALVFLVAVFCWQRGWLGGADAKLFGAGALLVAPGAAPGFVMSTCLAGGMLAAVYWVAGRLVAAPMPQRPQGLLRRIARIERRRLRRGGPLPYVLAVMVGACLTLVLAG